LNRRFAFTPCRRATSDTDAPGARASSRINPFSSRLQRRRVNPVDTGHSSIRCPPNFRWTPNSEASSPAATGGQRITRTIGPPCHRYPPPLPSSRRRVYRSRLDLGPRTSSADIPPGGWFVPWQNLSGYPGLVYRPQYGALHPAATASASLQNQRSPLLGSMEVREYQGDHGA